MRCHVSPSTNNPVRELTAQLAKQDRLLNAGRQSQLALRKTLEQRDAEIHALKQRCKVQECACETHRSWILALKRELAYAQRVKTESNV